MSVADLLAYQKAYEFLVWQKTVVMRLAKVHKYSLGIKIENETLALLASIVRANMAPKVDKARAIAECVVSVEILSVLFRFGHDLRESGGISTRHYAAASDRLTTLGNLCGAWLKKFKI